MEVWLLILTLTMLLTCFIRIQYRRSPLMIFSGLWFIITFLYSLRAYGVFNSSELTFSMYFYGIGSYFVGYILVKSNYKINRFYRHQDSNYKIRHRIFICLLYICIILMTLRAIKAIPLWVSGGASLLKATLYRGSELQGGIIETILYTYLALPMQIASSIYMIIMLFQKKRDGAIILLSLILTILFYVSTANKFIISQFIFLSIGYLLCMTRFSFIEILKKYKKVVFGIICIALIIIIIISIHSDFFQDSYTYLCGCIPMSDNALNTITSYPHLNGLITFNGFIRLLNSLFIFTGYGGIIGTLINSAFEFRQLFEETSLIGPGIQYNAYISMFSDFYMDGGMTGVITLSFAFGYISAIVKNKAFKKPSFLSVGILLFIILLIWASMIRIDIMMIYNVIALIIIIVLFPRISLNLNNSH